MIGIVRGVITVALLLLFTAMAVWAWSDRRKQLFESMARMALEEDAADAASSEAGRHE
jgi:cbb3-type cytochrome oxidase subunit 3